MKSKRSYKWTWYLRASSTQFHTSSLSIFKLLRLQGNMIKRKNSNNNVFKYDTSFIISILLWVSTLHLKCVSSFSLFVCGCLVCFFLSPFYTEIINQLNIVCIRTHRTKRKHNMKHLFIILVMIIITTILKSILNHLAVFITFNTFSTHSTSYIRVSSKMKTHMKRLFTSDKIFSAA